MKTIELTELLNNHKIRQLSPSSFKAYLLLIEKAGESKVIHKFSIRGQVKEWSEDKNLNLFSSKNTMKTVLNELKNSQLIKLDLKKRNLKIL